MKNKLFLGVLFALIGALFYSIQTAVIKDTATILPPLPVIIFVQSVISFILVLPVMFKNGLKKGVSIFKTERIPLHILRTVFSLMISFSLFYAVQFMPLTNAMLLANTVPFVVPFLAFFFLSQKINHRLWIPMIIGFVGVALVLHPDANSFNIKSLLALFAAVMMGATVLSVRELSKTESTITTMVYFFLFSTIISFVIAIPFWATINAHALGIMVIIGALYFFTQYAFTIAIRFAPPQLVSSLMYVNIVYAALISILVWGVYPSLLTFSGMVLIIMGGILCIHVTHRADRLAFIKSEI